MSFEDWWEDHKYDYGRNSIKVYARDAYNAAIDEAVNVAEKEFKIKKEYDTHSEHSYFSNKDECPFYFDEELIGELLHEITSLKEQLAEREWVSVEDRLPEKGDLVITVSDHGDTSSLYSEYFEGTKFWSKAFNNITHWMPLPSPPTGKE